MLKYFRIWVRFHEDIHIESSNFLLRGVIDTVEAKFLQITNFLKFYFSGFSVGMFPIYFLYPFKRLPEVMIKKIALTPRCQKKFHRVCLQGVINTTEFDTRVSLISLSPTPRCHYYRGVSTILF